MALRKLDETNFKPLRKLGVLREKRHDGTERCVYLGEWSGRQGIDIRDWKGAGLLGSGIFLNEDEVRTLRAILDNLDFAR